jgi:hypothetical protein
MSKLYELAESLFLYGAGYRSVEIKLIIALLYAKSLFLSREYIRCFELLQLEFINFPQFNSLLYAYAKYVVKAVASLPLQVGSSGACSDIALLACKNYIGSAIGALEECQRSQVKERQQKNCYYLGKAYFEIKRPLKVQEYWGALTKEYLDQGGNMLKKSEIKKFLISFREVKHLIQKIESRI